MVAQYLLQCIVEQVGRGVVGCTCITLVNVYTCHEVCFRILWQLLHDVNALVVLALGVNNLHRLVFADDHTLIANLATHLTIERSVVEHQFVESVLLLCHLTIAQYVTFIFRVVVTNKLLLTSFELNPVAILNLCSVAGTLFLLLHLYVKLLLVNGEASLAADKLSKVEREAVGVEQTEGRSTIQNSLALSLELVHLPIQEVDATLQGPKEGILLLLDDTCDEFLLSLQLWEGIAHLLNQYWQQLIHKSPFLSEERVCIAYGAAQDTTDHIASLCVRWQLTISNREGNSAQVVGTYTHSDVDIVLFLALCCFFLVTNIVETCQFLLLLDDWLEYVGVVVGVFALQGTYQSFEAHTRVDNVHAEFLQ